MTVWSREILERFVAPGVADFDAPIIPEPITHGESSEHWMTNHFLNSALRAQYVNKQRQLAFNIIYRAQACFEAHARARTLTADYLSTRMPGEPNMNRYFRALRAWEWVFLNFQIHSDLVRRLVEKNLFDQADGSPQQRAYKIANVIKHWSQVVGRDEHEDGDTVPMWLTNTGFVTREAQLTYGEMAELLGDCAVAANDLADPHERAKRRP